MERGEARLPLFHSSFLEILMYFSRILCSTLLTVAACASFQAGAADASQSFRSTANVVSSCKLDKQSDVSIGQYSPLQQGDSNSSAHGKFFISCTGGTVFQISVDEGLSKRAGSTCAAPLRSMKGQSGDNLNYDLNVYWTEAGLNEPATCDGSGMINMVISGGLAGLIPFEFWLTAQVPAGQNVQVGDFEDTVTVTLTF